MPPSSPTFATNRTSKFPAVSIHSLKSATGCLSRPYASLTRRHGGAGALYFFIFLSTVLGEGSGVQDRTGHVWGRNRRCARKCSITSISARFWPSPKTMPLAARPSFRQSRATKQVPPPDSQCRSCQTRRWNPCSPRGSLGDKVLWTGKGFIYMLMIFDLSSGELSVCGAFYFPFLPSGGFVMGNLP